MAGTGMGGAGQNLMALVSTSDRDSGKLRAGTLRPSKGRSILGCNLSLLATSVDRGLPGPQVHHQIYPEAGGREPRHPFLRDGQNLQSACGRREPQRAPSFAFGAVDAREQPSLCLLDPSGHSRSPPGPQWPGHPQAAGSRNEARPSPSTSVGPQDWGAACSTELLELPMELEAINAAPTPDTTGQGAGGTALGGPERPRASSKALPDAGEMERESQSKVT